MQQRKYRNAAERTIVCQEIMGSAYKIGLPDDIIQQLAEILDKYMASADKNGDFIGKIPIPNVDGKCIEYFLPGRRIHRAGVRVTDDDKKA